MTAHLADLIAQLDTTGSFATSHDLPPGDLTVEVAGVGPLSLPLRPATLRKLSGVARPSPFGLREQTLLDPSVRCSWEIPASDVRVRGRGWPAALAALLRKVQVELGLAPEATLEASFDKLLLYEKGQFFKAHQDSERDDDMVASLVVVLPSEYRGGELIVEHQGKVRRFPRPRNQAGTLSAVAFYSDCRHEVRPVTSGARLALTYQLRVRGGGAAGSAVAPVDRARELEASVRDHFARPVAERYSRAEARPAERLVVLLDHEYSQRSLGWERLKGADRSRVAALTAVGERLDCERFLALAEVHETWSCVDDEPYYGGYRRRYRRSSWRTQEEDDDERLAGDGKHVGQDYELLELEDAEMVLEHWVDAAGKRSPGIAVPVQERELVIANPSVELQPFRVEHEGYQGNYGNTVDRWYHRAALVMWPRANTFVLRAKAAPAWAVDQLLAIPPADVAELEAKIVALRPSWRQTASEVPGARFAARVMKVANRIQQPGLARDWLIPVGLTRLGSVAVRRELAPLVDRHGLEWAQRLFTEWRGERWYGLGDDAGVLPALCESLVSGGSVTGRALARWVVERELDAAVRTYLAGGSRASTWLELDAGAPDPRPLASLFDAAVAIGESMLAGAAMERLLGDQRTAGLPFLVALLRACTVKSDRLRDHVLGSPLREACLSRLAGLASRPPRTPDDWSLEVELGCACESCATLSRFLRSNRTDLDLPLAKDRRHHLHVLIDAARLPVLHATRREGRPFTLQLRKDRDLFRLDAEHRAKARTILRELGASPAAKAPRARRREAARR